MTSSPRLRRCLVAIGVVGTLALAGCSAGSDAPTDPDATADSVFDPADLVSTTPAGQQPVEQVTWALPLGEPPSLDPVSAGADSAYTAVANMCENLLLLTPDFAIEPGLATSAEWTSDTTFAIELRDDVTFWDGSPMTVDDVAFSLRRSADPANGANASSFARVTDIAVTGPTTVTLTFSAHDSQFRNTLASTVGVVTQQAFTEAQGDAFGTATGGLMCTGPFAFASWEPGQRIVLEANDLYRDGAPLVQTLELVFPNDENLTNGLASGAIDGVFQTPVASIPSLIESGAGELFIGPSSQSAGLGTLTSEGPAGDPRVRQALNLVFDRAAIISAVFGGYGQPQRTFIPQLAFQGMDAADIYQAGYDALPEVELDVAAAQALVEEAGATGAELDMVVLAGNQQATQMATIAQAAAAQIGITITISQMQGTDYAQIFYDPAARAGHDMIVAVGYLRNPGVLTYSGFFIAPDGIFNWTGYDDAQAQQLWSDAVEATDVTVAADDFVAAQSIWAPDNLQITFANTFTRVFMASDLTGASTSISYVSAPWAVNLGGK